MKCRLTFKDHAIDKSIDLGISDKELQNCIVKGAKRKSIIFNNNLSKHFIKYKYYEIVLICRPCHKYVETVY